MEFTTSSSIHRTKSSPSFSQLNHSNPISRPVNASKYHQRCHSVINDTASSDRINHLQVDDNIFDDGPVLPVVDRPPIITRRHTDALSGGNSSATKSTTTGNKAANPAVSAVNLPPEIPQAISTISFGDFKSRKDLLTQNNKLERNEIVGSSPNRDPVGRGPSGDKSFSQYTTTPTFAGYKMEMDASHAGHSHSPAMTHLKMKEINDYQMDLVVREVNQRLMDESVLFSTSKDPHVLPNFDAREVDLGEELGRGDFGVVYSVVAFNIDNCNCTHCLLKTHFSIGPTKVGGINSTESRPSTGNRYPSAKLSTASGDHYLDDMEKNIPNTIPESNGSDVEEDYEDDEELSSSGLSTLSSGSLIRSGGPQPVSKTKNEFMNIRQDHDTYTRCHMQRRAVRQGRPRYAVKRLRKDFAAERNKYDAAIDLAVESNFLKLLKHPNVIRIRGTVDKPGHNEFMIIMDCLNMTLREKMNDEWNPHMKMAAKTNRRRNSSSVAQARLSQSRVSQSTPLPSHDGPKNWIQKLLGVFKPPNYENHPTLSVLYTEKLMAMYDLARAMKYLRTKKILFRDLKPDNVGFDVRSRLKLFDFGLSKELKVRDLVDPPDSYDITGLAGSRRYMSPECCLCKYYGFASDVYAFSIVFWEVFSGKVAFDEMNFNDHFDKVVMKGKRPNAKIPGMPKTLINLMERMWAPNPDDRPDFDGVCAILRKESVRLRHDHHENGHHHHLSERTMYLMGQSARSQSNSVGPGSTQE